MKSKSRKGLKCLLAVAAVAVIAVIVYFTSFHNADVLKIKDGKVKGIKPTWLVGITLENGQETYVKVGDASAPKDYKAVSGADDADGDPITTNFVFVGKKPEQNPGTVTVQPWKGTLEQAGALEGASAWELTSAGTKGEGSASCVLVKDPAGEEKSMSIYLASSGVSSRS